MEGHWPGDHFYCDCSYHGARRHQLRRLLKELIQRYPHAVIVGHHDLNPHKDCPCFDAANEYKDLQPE